MGMVGCFAAFDPETMQRLRDDPERIESHLFPDDGESEPEHYVEVDKAWHGIHFLLAGSPDSSGSASWAARLRRLWRPVSATTSPAAWAVLGGEETGEEIGYGPARFLDSGKVREIADALPDEAVFASRFDPHAMTAAKIYPDVIWERDGAEALEYLVENYRLLLDFYHRAAGRGDGVVAWLS